MRVLVSDKLSEKGVEILKNSGITVDVNTKLSPEEILKVIGEYDGLIVRSATKVTAAVINAGLRLKAVGRAGAGLDNIDVVAAKERCCCDEYAGGQHHNDSGTCHRHASFNDTHGTSGHGLPEEQSMGKE